MQITKAQLAQLADHKGHLERDSGSVFVKFVGKYDMALKAFVGEPVFSELVDGDTPDAFSMSSLIAPAKPAARKKPTPDNEATE